MGLDVYVGSLTRYYAGNWETVVQKTAREQGLKVEVMRANSPPDAITNPNEIRPAVLSWRAELSQGLGPNIDAPLDWNESDDSPYFTDKPAWDSYSSLILWAAYAEHPELSRPHESVEDWATDPAFQRSADANFKSAFSQLMRDVELWLPSPFSFTFRAPDLTGNDISFGSSVAFHEQLEDLNRRTWKATDSVIAAWRREGAEHKAPLEIGARFAFSIMIELARQATSHRLIMKLDY